ncbi:hypothetical protein BET03_02955 [Thermohalobacter berrensis]|uniref:Uncharacterized protein n=2 Tax=Thermohalobacter berrensis TaxID=99594 RepID=A0A419T4E0_9FIRM|nr:hypothetical protein BET03_02955 [Thermohalobacter berrensis]
MEFELLQNGIDSLNTGVAFYEKYIFYDDNYEFQRDSYLKLSVISIQNAIEILGKKVLCDINELLIYKDISEPLLDLLKGRIENEFYVPIHEALVVSEADVFTISYKECITRLKHLFNISKKDYEDLKQIGKIRNKLIHLGLTKLIDYHEILGVINRVLDFIIEFFYPKLKKEKPEQMELLYDKICDLIEEGEIEEETVWSIFFAHQFEEINPIVKQACFEINEELALKKENIKVNLDIDKYAEASSFILKFEDLNEGLVYDSIFTINIPRLDVTFLIGECSIGPIYAVIDHLEDENNFYIYKKPLELDDYENAYKKFWRKDRKRCYRTSFDINSFKKVIMNRMM